MLWHMYCAPEISTEVSMLIPIQSSCASMSTTTLPRCTVCTTSPGRVHHHELKTSVQKHLESLEEPHHSIIVFTFKLAGQQTWSSWVWTLYGSNNTEDPGYFYSGSKCSLCFMHHWADFISFQAACRVLDSWSALLSAWLTELTSWRWLWLLWWNADPFLLIYEFDRMLIRTYCTNTSKHILLQSSAFRQTLIICLIKFQLHKWVGEMSCFVVKRRV